METVSASGCFDVIHPGHIDYLRQCATYGRVTVCLNSDEFIREKKGKLPTMTYEEREEVVRSIRYVTDVVMKRSHKDGPKLILDMGASVVVASGEQGRRRREFLHQMGVNEHWLRDNGVKLVFAKRETPLSSTSMKQRILHPIMTGGV